MMTMDRRSAVEQQYRGSGGGTGGKKRRVGMRLKRSASVSGSKFANSHLVSGENQQQSGAIDSLAQEISTVVQEQKKVLGLLRRKNGLFRGLGDRFKSVIRGTDGEHDLVSAERVVKSITAHQAIRRSLPLFIIHNLVNAHPKQPRRSRTGRLR